MAVPTFVDLQGFLIGGNFIVKEVAVLRKGNVLSHYIFKSPVPWRMLTKSEKYQTSWVFQRHHGLRWDDGNVPYHMAKRLITSAVRNETEEEDASFRVYVKGLEKRQWLADLIDDDARCGLAIETLDLDYEDVASLTKLDVANTIRCNNHIKHCALQNVFKLYNWWSTHHHEGSINPYL